MQIIHILLSLSTSSYLVNSFQLSNHRYHPKSTSLYGIDITGLPIDVSPDSIIQSANLQDTSSTIQNALVLVFGAGYLLYEKRPRGSARDDLIEIRKSNIPKANLGVFAKAFIPKGTIIGSYPGYLTQLESALKSKVNDAARDSCKRYLWSLGDNLVLDPTNERGLVDLAIPYLFGLYSADTSMARMNEPAPGGDCNVATRITSEEVQYMVDRDVFGGQELFLDYGCFYDRSAYDGDAKEISRQNALMEARKRREEADMVTLQPVTRRDLDDGEALGRAVDQDTSLADGFIAKLSRKKSDKLDRSGILSPESAEDMFTRLGAGMFSQTEEDKEFIDSLTGKAPKASKGILSPDDALTMFGGGTDDVADDDADVGDKALLESLRKQLGKDAMKNMDSIPNINTSRIPAPLINEDKTEPVIRKAALSQEEAVDLQNRLDNMTDEQVEKVFAKMRAALTNRAKEEVQLAMEQRGEGKERKSLPRAQVSDPEVRKKYNKELSAIEAELEGMYSDPLKVWQDIMLNPDKFAAGEETRLDDDELQ